MQLTPLEAKILARLVVARSASLETLMVLCPGGPKVMPVIISRLRKILPPEMRIVAGDMVLRRPLPRSCKRH